MELSILCSLMLCLQFGVTSKLEASFQHNEIYGSKAQSKLENSDWDSPTIDEYKEAAIGFFQQMAAVGHGNESVVVFGAMSLWNHFPGFRYTPDIDIQINEPSEDRLHDILVKMHDSSGGRLSWGYDDDLIFWTLDSGLTLFMDINYVPFGEMYGIGMTESASTADSIVSPESIPFSTPEEMFVIKLCASGRRLSVKKMWQDVDDAEFIAESMPQLRLIGDPIEKAYKCLAKFLPKSKYSEEWWYQKLGLSMNGTCTFADWFALAFDGKENLAALE